MNLQVKVSGEMWNNLELKESMLRIKSRHLWLKEGDRNLRLFS